MHLEDEEALVAADSELVGDSPLAAIVPPTAPLDLINAQSLPNRALQLYAVTISTADGDIAFVRKANPRTPAKAGRMFALLGNTLSRIGGPVFGLDDHFDLLVAEQGVIALNQAYFKLLFRETPALQQRIPEWIEQITGHLALAEDGAQRLAERAATDGRLRRRLRSIAERGHLATVTRTAYAATFARPDCKRTSSSTVTSCATTTPTRSTSCTYSTRTSSKAA